MLNSLTDLAPDAAIDHATDVSVRPLALGPGVDQLQVVREIHRFQLVVDEFSNVPGQVVVPANSGGGKDKLAVA